MNRDRHSATALACRLGAAAVLAAVFARAAVAADVTVPITQEGDDSKWVLTPSPNRADVFYDEAERLKLNKAPITQPGESGTSGTAVDVDQPLEYAKSAIMKIDSCINERKWDEAEKYTDTAIKKLSAITGLDELPKYLQVLTNYKQQIDEARQRDAAEAAFDALHLRVVGIMWAETGSRLVLIDGEPRALGINDRVKDCVIINIDTDRVDFRFHFNRKRFEFPRYVGEDSKAK